MQYNIIENIIKSFLGLDLKSETKNLLAKSLEEYVYSLEYRLTQTKNLIFRSEPVDFYQNYIPLTLVASKRNIRVSDPKILLDEYKNIGIIGSAGSGKTTLLKFIALSCLTKNYGIPVFIELRKYNKAEGNFEDFIAKQISSQFIVEIKTLFKSDKFVFIFDGYDEIDYVEGSTFINQIDSFITKFSSNKFIISSRPGTNLESISPLYIFHINPLNKDDIYLFIERLNITSALKRNIFSTIQQDNYLGELLNIPLFLSLYIVTYNSYNIDKLSKKSIFFRNVIDSLFSQHDSISKLGYVREKVSNLNKDDLEKVATILAFRMFFSSRMQLSKDEIFREFELIKKTRSYNFENDKLLFDLTITINILLEIDNYYLFPHISILEYLTAIFISNLDYNTKVSFYKRMNDNISVYFSYSFYQFLYELDYQVFVRYFLLPNIKSLLDNYDFQDRDIIKYNNRTFNLYDFINTTLLTNNIDTPINRSILQDLINQLSVASQQESKNENDLLFDIL